MSRRFIILFLACLAALIGSEYLFVSEVFNRQRLPVLLLSGFSLVCSIVVCWWAYRKFQKANTIAA
ncbi:MAG: hypothetical protein EOP50_09930 [Sphingobacteriales bacterium]|nr:MAG: hypothetical protein EOP50_09930 [Sphingobacteriales bacterium]